MLFVLSLRHLDKADGIDDDGRFGNAHLAVLRCDDGDGCNGVNDVHTRDHVAERGVFAVEVGGRAVGLVNDKELRRGRIVIVAAARHRDGAANVLEVVLKAVLAELALDLLVRAARTVIALMISYFSPRYSSSIVIFAIYVTSLAFGNTQYTTKESGSPDLL